MRIAPCRNLRIAMLADDIAMDIGHVDIRARSKRRAEADRIQRSTAAEHHALRQSGPLREQIGQNIDRIGNNQDHAAVIILHDRLRDRLADRRVFLREV